MVLSGICMDGKGADQLRSYCEADLRLCFRICKKPVFSERGSNVFVCNFCQFSKNLYVLDIRYE